jgi:hypothetical protein
LPADPVSVEEIMSRHDSDTWRAAMGEEMSSFVENDAWVLVDKPADQKVVQCKWVFKLEHGSDRQPSRYKAGLVVRGFTQQAGIDYDETFARVVRRETIRLLIALAAELNLQIHNLNVRTAFLNGELDERIFMNQPKGFIYIWVKIKSYACLRKHCVVLSRRLDSGIDEFTACYLNWDSSSPILSLVCTLRCLLKAY